MRQANERIDQLKVLARYSAPPKESNGLDSEIRRIATKILKFVNNGGHDDDPIDDAKNAGEGAAATRESRDSGRDSKDKKHKKKKKKKRRSSMNDASKQGSGVDDFFDQEAKKSASKPKPSKQASNASFSLEAPKHTKARRASVPTHRSRPSQQQDSDDDNKASGTDDIFDFLADTTPAREEVKPANPQDTDDILAEVFGETAAPKQAPTKTQTASAAADDPFDLLAEEAPTPAATQKSANFDNFDDMFEEEDDGNPFA